MGEPFGVLDIPDPLPRDVYLSAIRANDGSLVMFAIDSRGRSIGKVVLRGIVTRAAAERLLWAKLDAVDPVDPVDPVGPPDAVPQLRLVRIAEPPARPTPARPTPHVVLALCGKLISRSSARTTSR